MLIRRIKHRIRITTKVLLVIALMLPLAAITPAEAGETKTTRTAGKHVVKNHKTTRVKAAKAQRSKVRSKKTGAKTSPPKKAAIHQDAGPLKLASNIGTDPAAGRESSLPAAKPAKLVSIKPSQNEDVPALQIGKTLYQRNGEVRLRENAAPASATTKHLE